MSAARQRILEAVRAGTAARTPAAGPSHPLPARAGADAALERFVSMAEQAAATVARVADMAALPGAVAAWLAARDLSGDVVVAPALDGLDWAETGLSVRHGPARASDAVSVTPAVAGIAETGTLMVVSGPQTPNTLHFLPETHVAVLRAGDVVGGYEAAWRRFIEARNGPLPRAVTLITGPSRSSDIERTVQIGVHGPCRLHIVLVDGEET